VFLVSNIPQKCSSKSEARDPEVDNMICCSCSFKFAQANTSAVAAQQITPDIISDQAIAMFQEEVQRDKMEKDRSIEYDALVTRKPFKNSNGKRPRESEVECSES